MNLTKRQELQRLDLTISRVGFLNTRHGIGISASLRVDYPQTSLPTNEK